MQFATLIGAPLRYELVFDEDEARILERIFDGIQERGWVTEADYEEFRMASRLAKQLSTRDAR